MNRKQKIIARRMIKQLEAKKMKHLKKLKEVKRKKTWIDKEVTRLKGLEEELERVGDTNKGIIIKNMRITKEDKGMGPESASGIWIVEKRSEKGVELLKFFDFIKDTDPCPRLSLNLPSGPLIGDDGLEVTFNPGELLSCMYLGDIDRKEIDTTKDFTKRYKGLGFHFANVGPSGETSQLQYEYALGKLGLGIKVQPGSFLVVDGVFRKKVN